MNPKKKNKILITGGHSTPAIACIYELKSRGYEDLIYVGQKHTILFDKNVSAEYRNITEKLELPFINLIAGKFSLFPSISSLIWLFRVPIGFVQAFFIILRLKPSLILTFGSHVGVPIVFWAKLFQIPIIAHEQTTTFGRSNKFIQKLATKVCYSWPDLINQFKDLSNQEKYVLTGNPIRKEILKTPSKSVLKFSDNSKQTLLITGGNQGAHIINEWIFSNLEVLTQKFNVIHQTGSNTLFDDYSKAKKFAESINVNGVLYIPKDYIFGEEMSEAFTKASFVISRAGANTLIELVLLSKKALLIPIPTSSGNEQFLNASYLAKLGLAKVLDQSNLSSIDIIKNLNHLSTIAIQEDERKAFADLHINAEKKIIDLVDALL